MSASLSQAVTREDIAQATLQVIIDAIGACAGSLSLVRGDGMIETIGFAGVDRRVMEALRLLPATANLPGADAIRNRRPVFVESALEYERLYADGADGQVWHGGTRVAVPLLADSHVLGSINLGFRAWRTLAAEDRQLLATVAEECARALERARLFELEREAREQAESRFAEIAVLFHLSEAANRADKVDQLYDPALHAVIDGLHADRAAILLADPDGVMRFKAWRGLSNRYRAAVDGHCPWTAGDPAPAPIVVGDVDRDPALAPYRSLFREEGIRALAFIPLVHQRRLLGKLISYSTAPRTLSARDLQLAQTIASHLAQAVARAQLLESERRARAEAERTTERMRRLQVVTSLLSETLEPAEVAEIIVSEGASALGAHAAAIWTIGPATGELRLLSSVGNLVPELHEHAARSLASGGGSCRITAAPSFACVPLAFHGRAIAVLALAPGDARELDDSDRAFLLSLGHHCVQALERARLFAEEHAARTRAEDAQERTGFLLEASVILSSSLDFEAALARVSQLAVPRMADTCMVHFVTAPVDAPAVAEVIHTGRPEHTRSTMVVPMTARGKVFGAITFEAGSSGRHYTAADLEMAELLARRAAVAIDTALLYHSEASARTEAEQASHAREEILAIVSHDLRNPLNAIMLASGAILGMDLVDRKAAQIRKNVGTIFRSAERMARLIGDLVDFVGIQTRRLPLERAAHPCAEIVCEAVEMFTAIAEERRVHLEPRCPGELPAVDCDCDRAVQALSNLISNAINVTVAGGTVAVGAEQRGSEIVFYVDDRGPGIDPDDLPHIFQRYWRSEHASYRGTGLGLSIAKGIVDAHGGRIWADSTRGVGSRFAFALPVAR